MLNIHIFTGKNPCWCVVFIDLRDLMWYSTVISSAEREAAYVIDGLIYNDVVRSDIHSIDTNGYSEFIFGATFFLGFEFAPRIKGQSKIWSPSNSKIMKKRLCAVVWFG